MSTILVADDDADIRRLLEITLRNRGHEVVLADSGVTALELVEQVTPDFAILDVNMPGAEGTTVARRLRARAATATIPIVLLTALSGEADTLAGFAAGADDYVVKPFNPRELAARVSALLARAGAGSAPAPRPQGHLVAVVGPKGGVGRTTVAVNLAVAARRRAPESRVILIDGHLALGDLNVHLDLRSSPSLLDLVPYAGRLDVAALDNALVRHRTGIEVLLSPEAPEEAERITPALMQEVLHISAAIADTVVVDLGPDYADERALAALEAASSLLLVVTPDLGAARNTQQFLRLAHKLGLEPTRMRLLVNRVHERAGATPADIASALGTPALIELPELGPAATAQVALGAPTVEAQPRSELARRIQQLADLLLGAAGSMAHAA